MKTTIFLDIDGVLNSHQYNAGPPGWGIHPFHLSILKQIVERVDAQIVIHSTWKLGGIYESSDIHKALMQNGDIGQFIFSKIIGKTEDLMNESNFSNVKELEIQKYIEDNNVENFIIFDDLEITSFKDRQILTTMKDGLLPEHISLSLKLFQL